MPPAAFRRLRLVVVSATAAVAMSAQVAQAYDDGPYGPPTNLRRSCEPVAYPVEAALRRAQGVSRVRYTVSATGRAEGIELAASAGITPAHRLLDAAAVAFLQGCHFDGPPSVGGTPRQMDYVWRAQDVGRDRWTMVRTVDAEEPPDLYPDLLNPASCRMPEWPEDVRAKVPADDVMLRLDVDAAGRVRGAAMLHASGQAVIDDAVRDAALRCVFQPARRQGRAVAAVTEMLYPWAKGAAGLAVVRTSAGPAFRTAGEEAQYHLKNSTPRGCPDAGPPAADGAGEGLVTLHLQYDDAGTLTASDVVASSGSARFDDAARARFSSCGFQALFGDSAPIEDRLVTYRYFHSVPPPECAKLEYPAAAEADRQTGIVTVQVHVDASGAVQPATLLESSGHALLDEAAMNSFSRCTGAELRRAFGKPDQTFVYDFRLD